MLFGLDNSFLQPNYCSNVFNLCVFSPAIWRTGRCRCTLRFTGKERRTWTATGWPSGTQKNACRKVGTKEHQNTIPTSVGIHIHLLSLLCLLLQGPVFGNMDNFTGLGVFVDTYPNEEKHLEVRSHQTTWILHVAKNKQIGEGKCKPCRNAFCNVLKKAFVFFCATIWRQAQKKRYTPRTQVTRFWSLKPKCNLIIQASVRPRACFLTAKQPKP